MVLCDYASPQVARVWYIDAAVEGEEAVRLSPFGCPQLSVCLVLTKLASRGRDGFLGCLVRGKAFPNILEDGFLWSSYECDMHRMDLEGRWTEQDDPLVIRVVGPVVCAAREGVGLTHGGAWVVAEGIVEP